MLPLQFLKWKKSGLIRIQTVPSRLMLHAPAQSLGKPGPGWECLQGKKIPKQALRKESG
ncbi:MAG: hypothetical protein OEZ36_02725 [Spirochaetota bacterium]|nr:hypothetical protein [Spirochaetota bacterium]